MKENEIITLLGCGRETNRLTTLFFPKSSPVQATCSSRPSWLFFQIFGVSVCLCLRVCVRVNVSMGLCVRVVKTEAAPGCPAYTQTVPSLNHLTVPSTIHCPEHVFHLMCVLVEMKDTLGEESENENAGLLRERGCINIGWQSNFRLCSLCINKTNF